MSGLLFYMRGRKYSDIKYIFSSSLYSRKLREYFSPPAKIQTWTSKYLKDEKIPIQFKYQRFNSTLPRYIKDATARVASTTRYAKDKVFGIYEKAQNSSRINRTATLQLTAFWQNYGNVMLGITGLLLGYAIWRLSKSIWLFFSKKSSPAVVNLGSLIFAACIIIAAYIYLQRRYVVDPEAVYRLALLKLNTHPGILDVMGAPLVGSDLRVHAISRSRLKLESMRLKYFSKHVRMMFPLAGSERRGLVFLEATKHKGKYDLRVLGVDVPLANEQEERIYIIGNSSRYSQGGILASLRDPLMKTYLSQSLDEQADELVEAKEREEEIKRRELKEIEHVEEKPKPLDEGGGMYSYEKLYWRARNFGSKLNLQLQSWKKSYTTNH